MTKSTRNILIVLILIFAFNILSSCKNELSNPEIFKHIKLGDDYEKSCVKLNKDVCNLDLATSELYKFSLSSDVFPNPLIETKYNCVYPVTSDIDAKPGLYYGYYNEKKILNSATLLFYSPSSIPAIEFINSNHEYDPLNDIVSIYNGLPALTDFQANKIIKMYDVQYATRKNSGYDFWRYTWRKGDLEITLYKLKYGESIFMPGKVISGDAYQVFVTYHFVKEQQKLIKLDKKTDEGDNIGDKI